MAKPEGGGGGRLSRHPPLGRRGLLIFSYNKKNTAFGFGHKNFIILNEYHGAQKIDVQALHCIGNFDPDPRVRTVIKLFINGYGSIKEILFMNKKDFCLIFSKFKFYFLNVE